MEREVKTKTFFIKCSNIKMLIKYLMIYANKNEKEWQSFCILYQFQNYEIWILSYDIFTCFCRVLVQIFIVDV
jgi:hypothetical protein